MRYEILVENLEQESRRLFDHIGIGWSEKVLDFHKLDRPVKTASVWQVRQPVYKTSKAKWRQYEKELAPFVSSWNEGSEHWN